MGSLYLSLYWYSSSFCSRSFKSLPLATLFFSCVQYWKDYHSSSPNSGSSVGSFCSDLKHLFCLCCWSWLGLLLFSSQKLYMAATSHLSKMFWQADWCFLELAHGTVLQLLVFMIPFYTVCSPFLLRLPGWYFARFFGCLSNLLTLLTVLPSSVWCFCCVLTLSCVSVLFSAVAVINAICSNSLALRVGFQFFPKVCD